VAAGMEIWNPYGGKGNGECEFDLFLVLSQIRSLEASWGECRKNSAQTCVSVQHPGSEMETVRLCRKVLTGASIAVLWLLS